VQSVQFLSQIIEIIENDEGMNDEAQLQRALDLAADSVAINADRTVNLRFNIVALISSLKERIEGLKSRVGQLEAFSKRLEGRMIAALELHGSEIRGQDNIIKLRNNPESLDVDIETKSKSISNYIPPETAEFFCIPGEYLTKIEAWQLNTAKLKEDLQAGKVLSWARLKRNKGIIYK
jgi:hypothetical protein